MKNTTQGFTLIELLIVIAIIGILAAVLIPNLLGAQKRAYDTASLNCAKQIQTAQVAAQGDYQTFVTNDSTGTGTADKALSADLISNCSGNVKFGATAATAATIATATADSKLTVTGTGTAANTYTVYVWNTKGSKVYLVNPTTVQAQ